MTLNQQIVFRQQLLRFLKNLPSNDPLAICMRDGPRAVIMQNFTASRAKLLAAASHAIPHFHPVSFETDTEWAVFSQIAAYLSQFPGRKNILWFNGGSNLFLQTDRSEIHMRLNGTMGIKNFEFNNNFRSARMRKLYNLLEADRIAVYPIDVRGLTVINDLALRKEKGLATEEATATGGKAYYGTNNVAKIARQLVDHSADFYTITYKPNDLNQIGHWHKVRLKVDGHYHLSYRHGYFDENFQATYHPEPLIASNGDTFQAPNFHSNPILFQARITPASAPADHTAPLGTKPYLIRYILPVAAFPTAPIDAKNYKLTMSEEAAALDNSGAVRSEKKSVIVLSIPAAAVHAKLSAHFTWQQIIYLHRGEQEVLLAVWNTSTGRLGTLQIPLTVKKH